MVASLSSWWMRIVVYILWVVTGVMGIAVLAVPSISWSMVLLTVFLAGGIVAIEVLRPGGSLFTSGLGLTPRVLVHAGSGTGIALVSLAGIAGVGVLMGAHFFIDIKSVSVSILLGVVAQSIAEEFMFRGPILDALHERYGPLVAIGVTSILFGLLHGSNPGANVAAIVNVMIAGVLLGIMVVQSGSLWMSMMFHATWNLGTMTFYGTVSGTGDHGWISTLVTDGMAPETVWFLTGPFGIEQGVVTSIVLIGAIVVVVGWVHMDRAVAAARIRRTRTVESRNAHSPNT